MLNNCYKLVQSFACLGKFGKPISLSLILLGVTIGFVITHGAKAAPPNRSLSEKESSYTVGKDYKPNWSARPFQQIGSPVVITTEVSTTTRVGNIVYYTYTLTLATGYIDAVTITKVQHEWYTNDKKLLFEGNKVLTEGEIWILTASKYLGEDGSGDKVCNPLGNTAFVEGIDKDEIPFKVTSKQIWTKFQPAFNGLSYDCNPDIAEVGDKISCKIKVMRNESSSDDTTTPIITLTGSIANSIFSTPKLMGTSHPFYIGEVVYFETESRKVQPSDPLTIETNISITGIDPRDKFTICPVATTLKVPVDFKAFFDVDMEIYNKAETGVRKIAKYDIYIDYNEIASDGSYLQNVMLTTTLGGLLTGLPIDGDTNNNKQLEPNERWHYQFPYIIPITAPTRLDNWVTVTAQDRNGDIDSRTTFETLPVPHNPKIQVKVDAPATATFNQTITPVIKIAQSEESDHTPIRITSVKDQLKGVLPLAVITGDNDNNGWLDWGETFQFTNSVHHVNIQDPIDSMVTVEGYDFDTPIPDHISPVETTYHIDVIYAPQLSITATDGIITAGAGTTVTLSYEIKNDLTNGDGSLAYDIIVKDESGKIIAKNPGPFIKDSLTFDFDRFVPTDAPSQLPITVTVEWQNDKGISDSTFNTRILEVTFGAAIDLSLTHQETDLVREGDVITYTIALNVGGDKSPIYSPTITSSLVGVITAPNLSEGNGWQNLISYTITATDSKRGYITHEVEVSGLDQTGKVITQTKVYTIRVGDLHQADLVIAVSSLPTMTTLLEPTPVLTIEVTNLATSTSPITFTLSQNLSLDTLHLISGTDKALPPGETAVYTTSYPVTQDTANPLINIIAITGTDSDGDPLRYSQEDNSRLTTELITRPLASTIFIHTLNIIYQPVLTFSVSLPLSFTLRVGKPVYYQYKLKHTRNISNTLVGDGTPVSDFTLIQHPESCQPPSWNGDFHNSGKLDPDETLLWDCKMEHPIQVVNDEPFTITEVVTGLNKNSELATPLTDTHTTLTNTLVISNIEYSPTITVEPLYSRLVKVGETITYEYKIMLGDDFSPIKNVVLTDSLTGQVIKDCNLNIDNWSCSYTTTYPVASPLPEIITSVYTITGEDLDGDTLIVTGTTVVGVTKSDSSLKITIEPPLTTTLTISESITLIVTLKANELNNEAITVTELLVGGKPLPSFTTTTLAPDEPKLYSYSYTVPYPAGYPTKPYVSITATANGIDEAGDAISSNIDFKEFEVKYPSHMRVTIEGVSQAKVGDTINLTIVLASTDNSPIHDLNLTSLWYSNEITALVPREVVTYTTRYTIEESDSPMFIYTVTVSGTNQVGYPVKETAMYAIPIKGHWYDGVITFTKKGPSSPICPGITITYRLNITNGSGTTLSQITILDKIAISDKLIPLPIKLTDCTQSITKDELIQVAEVITCLVPFSVTKPIPPEPIPLSFMNVATLTGMDSSSRLFTLTAEVETKIKPPKNPLPDNSKGHAPEFVKLGDTVTYTYIITPPDGEQFISPTLFSQLTKQTYPFTIPQQCNHPIANGTNVPAVCPWQCEITYTTHLTDQHSLLNTSILSVTTEQDDNFTNTIDLRTTILNKIALVYLPVIFKGFTPPPPPPTPKCDVDNFSEQRWQTKSSSKESYVYVNSNYVIAVNNQNFSKFYSKSPYTFTNNYSVSVGIDSSPFQSNISMGTSVTISPDKGNYGIVFETEGGSQFFDTNFPTQFYRFIISNAPPNPPKFWLMKFNGSPNDIITPTVIPSRITITNNTTLGVECRNGKVKLYINGNFLQEVNISCNGVGKNVGVTYERPDPSNPSSIYGIRFNKFERCELN